jgi:hypothetical protein
MRIGQSGRYSRIRMKDKVRQFPQRANGSAASNKEPMILFTLGDRRFTVQWIITEVRAEPAELILLQKKRRGTGRARPKR